MPLYDCSYRSADKRIKTFTLQIVATFGQHQLHYTTSLKTKKGAIKCSLTIKRIFIPFQQYIFILVGSLV